MKHPIEPDNNPTVAHEHTDADSRAITQFGIALTFFLIVSQLVLWWVFSSFSKREQKLSPPVPAIVKAEAPHEPPEPRLQANPQLDMRKMLEEENEALTHYGWVDPDRGIVRLPIERALDILAKKGLPQFKAEGAKPKTTR
ncbi:MAG: hypothetical protein LAP39_09675 [Acidobacteriia bacterium]|nr:hypothetical protein [Terriglobia bacterium]